MSKKNVDIDNVYKQVRENHFDGLIDNDEIVEFFKNIEKLEFEQLKELSNTINDYCNELPEHGSAFVITCTNKDKDRNKNNSIKQLIQNEVLRLKDQSGYWLWQENREVESAQPILLFLVLSESALSSPRRRIYYGFV